MKTEHALARVLKEMMSNQPLDTISVMEISNKCGVSRKTFYYHYHDIYDLLTQVFLNEKIPNANACENYDQLIETIWKYYKNNEQFINATLNSAGKDLFSEFIFNVFYTSTIKFLNRYESSKNISIGAKKSIARFYASGYSNSLVYYLSNYKNKSLNGLKECFAFVNNSNLQKSLQKVDGGEKNEQ